jgi:hypothetical protein
MIQLLPNFCEGLKDGHVLNTRVLVVEFLPSACFVEDNNVGLLTTSCFVYCWFCIPRRLKVHPNIRGNFVI